MKPLRHSTGLFFVVALAFVGFLLVYIPPRIIEQYEIVSRAGPFWVTVYFVTVGTGGALLLGLSGWTVWGLWRRTRDKTQRRARRNRSPSELSAAQQQRELAENLASVEELQGDPSLSDELRRELSPLVERALEKQAEQTLEIVAFGTVSSGKSSLLNALAGREVFATDAKGGTTVARNEVPWTGLEKVTLVDTPGLGEIDGAEHVSISAAAARDADLVLLVVDGPLRESEFALLQKLGEMEKRVLVCLNKADWYSERDKSLLLGQISKQTAEFIKSEDVLAVRTRGAVRSRVRVLPDGSECEEEVSVPPDISPLAERMLQVVRRDGRDLLLANLLLQSRGLVEEARERARQSLDERAWVLVNRYMWGAAGAAAVSPFPIVDLAAGFAVSTKMVLDLAVVYRQPIDLDAAMRLLAELGKNLIAILGVSAVTPLVAAVSASLLKSVPGAGTLAGGVLQGLVQALVTRWIGAVFIAYFRNEMHEPEGGLAGLARREWARITSVDQLRKLVQVARAHWKDAADE